MRSTGKHARAHALGAALLVGLVASAFTTASAAPEYNGGDLSGANARTPSTATIFMACATDNDVFTLLSGPSSPVTVQRFDTPTAAIAAASDGSGLMVLADGYPFTATAVSAEDLAAAATKRLRTYLELPASLPNATVAAPTTANYFHRVVAGPKATLAAYGVPAMSILMAQGAYFVAVLPDDASVVEESSLVFDHVAGSTSAVFGLTPKTGLNPVMFEYSAPGLPSSTLVAATKLSQIVTARYAPYAAWKGVWSYILSYVARPASGPAIAFPDWTPLVNPAYAADAKLPADAELTAFRLAVDWLSWSSNLYVTGNASCPAPYARPGDSIACVLEGFSSHVQWNGTQALAGEVRTDCNAETAMALALRGLVDGNSTTAQQAAQVMDYVYTQSVAQQGPRANPSDPAYGLIAWGVSDPAWIDVFYGDDNARVLLGSMAAAASLRAANADARARGAEDVVVDGDLDRWDVPILRAALANLRTTAVTGFRPGRIDLPDLEHNGWKSYWTATYNYTHVDSPQPHFQSFLWAVYLWAYKATGLRVFYDRAEAGLRATMDVYEQGDGHGSEWVWTEYLSEERAHMLLPLAWLVRVNNTQEHASWLSTMVNDYAGHGRTQPCGAVQEWFGAPGKCTMCPPGSNAEYGSHESPMTQTQGDPVVDLLYSNNFAFPALVEAFAATGDEQYDTLATGLGQFMARAQTVSTAVPEVNGAYMRAFDYQLWEAYGEASDPGWGPWCVETGWTEGWIAAGHGLRALNTSLWDLTLAHTTIDATMGLKMCKEMLPQGACV